jgi:hypothetical protein
MDENGLYDFHQSLVTKLGAGEGAFNWHCDLEIPAIDLGRIKMVGVYEEAAQWRRKEPAPDMYFSHGQYYQDGIQHIIEELKCKSTSNRAMYSLLAQKDISRSGDAPIPSFLTFQCSIEHGSILYCTASFRALEVGTFLRVNLEEIRQNLVEIYEAFPAIETVRLHIFAFHAYVRTVASVALRRPEIEVTPQIQLMLLMQKGDVSTLDQLLGGLEQSTTVVSPKSLENLLQILRWPGVDLHEKVQTKQNLLELQLKQAIVACEELKKSREGASRGVNTAEKIKAFQEAVKNLRGTLLS